jgi:dipeptidyl-peptidase-3
MGRSYLKEQKLVYYLTQAGTSGRDIMWDQHYKYNLKIRTALEHIYQNYNGDKTSGEILKFILREFGFEFITIIRVIKSNLIFKSLETVMKATKTELESAVVAVIL